MGYCPLNPGVGDMCVSLHLISCLFVCLFRIYRVRQHLMPLTDIEGSEDSDDDSLDDHNSSFQVRNNICILLVIATPSSY